MINVTTIGWWNGQSHLLDALFRYSWWDLEISSIVSMCDDGRTTWRLMRIFHDNLWLDLPPTWDLRRCFVSLSTSKDKNILWDALEKTFSSEKNISSYKIIDLFNEFWLKKIVEDKITDVSDLILQLDVSIKWHKLWNIFMASLYYNFDADYDRMVDYMHKLFEIKWRVIPVTTSRALIKAVLWNWEVVESQDRISNVASYTSGIADLELMDCSKDANHTQRVDRAIKNADYIIIWPWDLFTSIISNFIIGWVKESISKSKAELIYIWNTTNKWWETNSLTQLDFVNKIERFLLKKIDYFIVNNHIPKLSKNELDEFKNDISVKWWDFLLLSSWEKRFLELSWVKVIEEKLLWDDPSYRHDKKVLARVLNNIFMLS